jgi:hypothetical protein
MPCCVLHLSLLQAPAPAPVKKEPIEACVFVLLARGHGPQRRLSLERITPPSGPKVLDSSMLASAAGPHVR